MDSGIYYLWKVIYSGIVYSTIHEQGKFIFHYPCRVFIKFALFMQSTHSFFTFHVQCNITPQLPMNNELIHVLQNPG